MHLQIFRSGVKFDDLATEFGFNPHPRRAGAPQETYVGTSAIYQVGFSVSVQYCTLLNNKRGGVILGGTAAHGDRHQRPT